MSEPRKPQPSDDAVRREGGRAGGAPVKTGPPSDELDGFPTLQENPMPLPSDDPSGDIEASQSRPPSQPASSVPAQPTPPSVNAPTSMPASEPSNTGAGPIVSADATSKHASEESHATRTMAEAPRQGFAAVTPPSPHIKPLIEAGLFAPPSPVAAARGAFAVVESRYELRDLLGEGGMGLVFLAYDSVGDCKVAVKTLKPSFLSNEKARVRFIEEAKEMNRIPAHACVLVVKDFGSTAKPFYVTEYLTGGTVGQAIRANGPLSADLARRYAANIVRAIAFIHAKHGKLHRDIKPENVLIDDDGSARLADFGLIWHVGEGARGLRAGTVPYMPPEVVSDSRKNVGFEWDVYSFGATLYEMLVGHAPYADLMDRSEASTGKSRIEVLKSMIADQPPTPILALNKKADRHLARIADWAMARDARDRYFHVNHILADLERIERGRKPLGPQQKDDEPEGRVPMALIVSVLVVLALAAAAGWYVWQQRQATPADPTGGIVQVDPTPTPPSNAGQLPDLPQSPSDDPPIIDTPVDDAPSTDTPVADPVVKVPATDHTGPWDPKTKTPGDDVTNGSIFDQTRHASPMGLTFDTVNGIRRYVAAPDSDWAKIRGRSFPDISDMPWTPAPENHLVFRAGVDQPGYLMILIRSADGTVNQLFPNINEQYMQVRPSTGRTIPPAIGTSSVANYNFVVTPGPSTDQIKAIVADRPFEIVGVTQDQFLTQQFPVLPQDFKVRVNGRDYDSLADAFGENYQTVEFDIQTAP